MELLHQKVILFLRKHQTLSTVAAPFYIAISNVWRFHFSTSCQHFFFHFIMAILAEVKEYLMILIYISLVIN
jgi:hypothetical protein